MDEYSFILIFRQDVAAHLTPGPVLDALFEAGCDDGTFGVLNGVPDVLFTREAPSYAEAVLSAIHEIVFDFQPALEQVRHVVIGDGDQDFRHCWQRRNKSLVVQR